MNTFYVIIGVTGGTDKKFREYDIMPYLSRVWKGLKPKDKTEAKKDIKDWVKKELMYQFWSRAEYEILLVQWPCGKMDDAEKIDIYTQANMNLDLIVRLFKENEGIK